MIYLKAIIAARKGDAAGVREAMGKITSQALRERAAKDIELVGYDW